MNKKFLLAGLAVVTVTGFITLTAFGGQTKEQQQQEIASAITAQLDEFRMQKQQECTDMVLAEAQRRYDEYVASLPPAKPAKPGAPKKSTPKKPATAKDPMPEKAPEQSSKDAKMQQSPTNTEAKDAKMMKTPTNTEGKDAKMKKTMEGGGN